MNPHALSALALRTEDPPISWLMRTALANPSLISLAAGFTDNSSLPVGEVQELVGQLMTCKAVGQAALQYGTTVGDEALRLLTIARLAALDGAAPGKKYSADHMVITTGSQQMLYMTVEALCDPGAIVLVEDPTYFVFLGILQSHGVETRGVRLEQDGIDLQHLESELDKLKREGNLPRLKLLYVVSYHQNPTGTTTSASKKAGMLRLLRRYERHAGHPIYLLEDAAYRELRFSGQDVPSAVKSGGSRVIYAGTYSKPFATGTRVGFGLLPGPLHKAVLRIKGNHDFGTSNLLQKLLAKAIETGLYDRHVQNLRRRYAAKAGLMGAVMREGFPGSVEWQEPKGGLYFWVRLPSGVASGSKSRLFLQAMANNVLYVPGMLCYASEPGRPRPDHEMRISFGGVADENIHEGIRRLAKAIHQATRKTGMSRSVTLGATRVAGLR